MIILLYVIFKYSINLNLNTMIEKNSFDNFINIANWCEIFEFKSPVDYHLLSYFIKGYETYFEQVDLNTIYNTYSNKNFKLKIGIDLTGYDSDHNFGLNIWINDNYYYSKYRIPYNIYDTNNNFVPNGTPVNRIKYFYSSNKKNIFYYTKQ